MAIATGTRDGATAGYTGDGVLGPCPLAGTAPVNRLAVRRPAGTVTNATPGPDPVAERVAAALDAGVASAGELDGGQVGEVHRVDLADGTRVVAKTGPTPLTLEARMLAALGERGLPVPDVHYASDALLVLSFLPGGDPLTADAERDAARHLAALHDHTADRYGFPFDTLSGRYHQPNPRLDDWPAFYGDARLGHVARAARDEERLPSGLFERVAAVRADLADLLPADPPASLLHGDVWPGNLRIRGDGVAGFLDPACYHGHAELDLAYATWAGLGDPFLAAYREQRGIADGFRERRDVYLLLPLLEHVRHFHTGEYCDRLARALDRLGY